MPEYAGWSVGELATAIRTRRTTCTAVTQNLLEHAHLVDAKFDCFTQIDDGAALERAAGLDRLGPEDLSPIRGVPFARKDIFVTRDRAPTAGARGVSLTLRARTSPVLDRLEGAGAVSLGALNLDQFGYAATGINPDFGNVRNPWNPQHIAGGSSGGAAAAVATGALPFAIGTDTGGSVRIPASYCGVVGLKPTLGRISKRGAIPVSYSQDTVGILARSVDDVAIVLQATAGYDELDPSSIDAASPRLPSSEAAAGLEGLRLGVDHAYLETMTAEDVRQAVARTVATLVELGATVVEVDLSGLARYDVAASVLTWAEAGAVHRSSFAAQPEAYAATIRTRLGSALRSRGTDHVDALRFQGRALHEFHDQVLAAVDIVVTASTARSPATLEEVISSEARALEVSLEALRLNRPFSFLGLPALSLPAGFASDALPIGVQLIARPWADAELLACGAAYQRVTDWHRTMPPIVACTRDTEDTGLT